MHGSSLCLEREKIRRSERIFSESANVPEYILRRPALISPNLELEFKFCNSYIWFVKLLLEMQDIHSLGSGGGGGGGGRLFGVDRRLRLHNTLNHHQPLKCPRCESLNTKFCYYNNYNLSQPRHFCKGCRRYWTKGGVLRNVPVGGGCRKNKRSSKPKQPTSDTTATPAAAPRKSNSHSSSESSSLTATTTTATAATEVVSGGSSSNSAPTLFNFAPDSQVFTSQAGNPTFNPPLIDQSPDGGSIFPEIGTFTGLMTSSNDPPPLCFNIADISSYRLQNQNQGQLVENQSSNHEMQEMGNAGYLDQTGQIEFSGSQSRISNGGLAGVDWQAAGGDEDQGMFELTGSVEQAYWSQTQWPDHNDHSLHYLP